MFYPLDPWANNARLEVFKQRKQLGMPIILNHEDGKYGIHILNDEKICVGWICYLFFESVKDGNFEKKLEVNRMAPYEFVFWEITGSLMYLCQSFPNGERITLWDRELKRQETYCLDRSLLSHKIIFDPSGRFLYAADGRFLIQINRETGEQKHYENIYCRKLISILGILNNGVLVVEADKTLLLFDTKNEMQLILKKVFRGEIREIWMTEENEFLLLAYKNPNLMVEEDSMGEVYFYEVKKTL